ncbi:hypothetical protein G6F70_002120 [Rhizopus microsporus]|nr:hypothetical protein G6F71_002934 [Rhizopus microsporus]KAG1202626.1 hypothetical protein G6F70_002120 [Rhizopus microsporus]KAG1214298.1 hypothetical protein G6F69_002071 [Rhizopus microsporus]KAG1236822.1 hypothetical protein G6F67_001705 [Rhizopus microsporus]KAG1267878.1 hypothetical protein G6F68_001581 [Rhizopus microsporus]
MPSLPQFASSIAELQRRAFVDRSKIETYSIKSWISSAEKLYQQGDVALLVNDLEDAYVAYMKGSTIMIEIVRLHSDYLKIKTDPLYAQLRKRTDNEIVVILRDLASKIDFWYSYQQQLGQMSSFYYHSHVPLQLPSYAYNHELYNYSMNDLSSAIARQNIMAHANLTSPNVSQRSSPLRQAPITVSSSNSTPIKSGNSMTALTHDISKLTLSNNVSTIPSWTNHKLPESTTIEPLDLSSRIQVRQHTPTILLIDVRSRDTFISGCIQHKWIVQIEPSVLGKDATARQIEESLVVNPSIERSLFIKRDRFDLIVYYDQHSKTIETADAPLKHLRRVLESHQLKHPPMMLAGGFDAWQFVIGERGIYKFPVIKEKKSWFKSTTSLSSFTGKKEQQHKVSLPISKPQPLPTAPRKESITTRYPEMMTMKTEPPNAMLSSSTDSIQMQPTVDLQPAPPTYAKLHRRRTFIDNPFNGFTATSSKLYDVPPMQTHSDSNNLAHKAITSSVEPSITVSRPSTLGEFHHTSTSNLHSTPSNMISQQGGLIAIGTTGLKNLGNTCYMNSIIQCLSGTLPFARYFISGVFRQHINRHNTMGTGGLLSERFADLLRAMWSENYNFVSPMTFREAVIKFAPRFGGNDQHDSQEFLTVLLDGLHEDVNLAAVPSNMNRITEMTREEEAEFEKLPDWQASALAWEKYTSRHTSIVVSLFQGQYRSRLTCLTCKHTSSTYSPFMSLSLPIPAKKLKLSNVTLYQCLDYFVKEEVLEKEDAWNCPRCCKKRKATKQLMISKLPDVLLIHLKRFSADGLFKNKLDCIVKYPTKGLDLHNYITRSTQPDQTCYDRSLSVYDLYAVSNHYGSLSGGHYTAFVKDGHRNQWHFFDDSKFSTIDESKIVTKAAYNLFYVRSKVK